MFTINCCSRGRGQHLETAAPATPLAKHGFITTTTTHVAHCITGHRSQLTIHIDSVYCKLSDHVCEKAFSQRPHLKKHMESEHAIGIKKFICNLGPLQNLFQKEIEGTFCKYVYIH